MSSPKYPIIQGRGVYLCICLCNELHLETPSVALPCHCQGELSSIPRSITLKIMPGLRTDVGAAARVDIELCGQAPRYSSNVRTREVWQQRKGPPPQVVGSVHRLCYALGASAICCLHQQGCMAGPHRWESLPTASAMKY